MFRNDQQRGRVCQVLTANIPHGPFWVPDEVGCPRPNGTVRQHLRRVFASSEVVLVRVAWDVWNAGGKPRFDRVLDVLDGPNLRKVGSLLVAIGASSSTAIDDWVVQHWPDPLVVGCPSCRVPAGKRCVVGGSELRQGSGVHQSRVYAAANWIPPRAEEIAACGGVS